MLTNQLNYDIFVMSVIPTFLFCWLLKPKEVWSIVA